MTDLINTLPEDQINDEDWARYTGRDPVTQRTLPKNRDATAPYLFLGGTPPKVTGPVSVWRIDKDNSEGGYWVGYKAMPEYLWKLGLVFRLRRWRTDRKTGEKIFYSTEGSPKRTAPKRGRPVGSKNAAPEKGPEPGFVWGQTEDQLLNDVEESLTPGAAQTVEISEDAIYELAFAVTRLATAITLHSLSAK